MKKLSLPLPHQGAMLAALCALAVWRLTGVPFHEYLAVAFAAGPVRASS